MSVPRVISGTVRRSGYLRLSFNCVQTRERCLSFCSAFASWWHPVSMTMPASDLKMTLPDQFPDELPIEEMGLDTRLQRALVNEGLKTAGDVRDMSDVELRCVRRIGNLSFRILRELLGPSRSLARLAQ